MLISLFWQVNPLDQQVTHLTRLKRKTKKEKTLNLKPSLCLSPSLLHNRRYNSLSPPLSPTPPISPRPNNVAE
jgi:hypothetical protein